MSAAKCEAGWGGDGLKNGGASLRGFTPPRLLRKRLPLQGRGKECAPPASASIPPKLMLQLRLRPLQAVALGFRQGLAGAVDVEGQHR